MSAPVPAAEVMVPRPATGRTFEARRLARFGDISPGGRLRLDAIGRYLQDVSGDDIADAGWGLSAWVVRRLAIETETDAVFREGLTLCTWCSGTGSRWAERRVSIAGDRDARIEAAALWVHVDIESGVPQKLSDDFVVHYADAAAGRKVSARLRHDATIPSAATRRPWPLRFADFDPLRHVNNAVHLAALEEELGRRRDLRAPLRIEVEYRAGIEPGASVTVATTDRPDGGYRCWLVDEVTDTLYATADVGRRVS